MNVRSITLTENGCTSPEDRVLSDRRGDGCSRSATPRGEMSFVVAAGAAVFVMLTQDEGALTLQWARARTVRFARKSGKAELRPFIVVTILGLYSDWICVPLMHVRCNCLALESHRKGAKARLGSAVTHI